MFELNQKGFALLFNVGLYYKAYLNTSKYNAKGCIKQTLKNSYNLHNGRLTMLLDRHTVLN